MNEGKGVTLVAIFIGVFFAISTVCASEPKNTEGNKHHVEHGEGHKTESANIHHADDHGQHEDHHVKDEKFDPAKFMFDHIGDSYDWHLFDTKTKQISVPLPVILFSKEKGFNIFMSSKFHHGHSAYKGFYIGHEGETIVKLDKKGKPVLDKENNPIYIEVEGKIVETLDSGAKVLPFDISITKNVAALFFSIFLVLWVFLSVAKAYKRNPNQAPTGLQSLLEPIILFIRDELAIPSIGKKKYAKFMPYLLTVFFFILFNNLLGLVPIIPGGANVTGNIAITFVLALFTFIITTINGNKSYWQHIFNTPGVPIWLKIPPLPIMPIVETIGIFTKPFVLMVRLFANITAGHIIVLGFLSLIFIFGENSQALGYGVSLPSVLFVIFLTFLELLVAFIQAYVFTFLSALYIGMAVEEHH